MMKLSKHLILCLLIATPAYASGPPAASLKAVGSKASKAKAKAPANAKASAKEIGASATKEKNITVAEAKALATLNNDSVRAMNKGDYKTAADLLLQALKINPKYHYGRSNLAICYNNLALKSPAATAMALFHKALVLDSENTTTKANLEALITSSKRIPTNFDDRVFLANQALKEKDYVSAVGEFNAALAIKDDEEIRKQLAAIPRTDTLLILGAIPKNSVSTGTEVDFRAYMQELQRKIKTNWHPPKSNESKRSEVQFQVHQDGSVTKVRLSKPSGIPASDQCALAAVSTTAPFDKLPPGAPPFVEIQFTFDYNVFGGASLSRGASSNSVREAANKVIAAKSSIQNKDYNAALKALEAARALDENNYDAPKLLAAMLCLQAAKDPSVDKQSEIAYRALDLDMTNAEAQKLLANAITKKNKNPQRAADRVELAQGWLDQRNYKNARIEVQAALKLDSNNAAANKMLPLILKDEAIGQIVQRWQHALELRNNAENHAGLGYAYEMANHIPEADAEYKKALGLDPYCIIAKQRFEALKQSSTAPPKSAAAALPSNPAAAALPAEPAVPSKPAAAALPVEASTAASAVQAELAAQLKEAAAYHAQKSFDRSIGEYMKAVKIDSKSEEAWYGLANALQGKSDYTRAIKAYSKAIQLKPNHVEATKNLLKCQELLLQNKGKEQTPQTDDFSEINLQ